MNGLDVVLAGTAIAGFVYGAWKGLARILLGIASVVVGFVTAARLGGAVAFHLRGTGAPEEVLRFAGYVLVFGAVVAAGALAGWVTRKMLAAASLGWADRLAGGFAGIVASVLAAAVLLLPLVAWMPWGESWAAGSRLAPYVAAVADAAAALAPDDLARRWREKIDSVRRHWRGESVREMVERGRQAGGRNGTAQDHCSA